MDYNTVIWKYWFQSDTLLVIDHRNIHFFNKSISLVLSFISSKFLWTSLILSLMLLTSGLDGKGMQTHLHAPTHAILKTHMWNVAHLKHCMCLPLITVSFVFYNLNYTFNALSVYIQIIIYFTSSIKWILVFRKSVTCNHLNTVQTIVHLKV